MYIILQSTYTEIELGLFNSDNLIAKQSIDKHSATSLLIPTLDKILKEQNLKLQDLDFVGVNLGPAPFTTLRVVIAAVNGLAFASGIKLVGVDGIKTLWQESGNTNAIALLNAFANDVYYATSEAEGCKNIDLFLEDLSSQNCKNLYFVGNGATLFKNKILAKFPNSEINDALDYASLEAIAKSCFEKFKNKEGISNKLMPMYLKSAV